jgi:cysteinyl-tRNA synthetase
MHNAFMDIDGEKMSKSLGNVRTVRELLNIYRGEVLRFALLSAHYRTPLNFSAELLEQAQATLDSFYSTLRDVRDIKLDGEVSLADEPFYQALNDDLNTPLAIAEMHALAKQLHKARSDEKPILKARLLAAANMLGILEQDPAQWLQQATSDDAISAVAIEALIKERHDAKLAKNYARADEVRAALLAQGVVLEDSREGTQWKRKSD